MPEQKSKSAVTITANKMDVNNKTIHSKSTGNEGYTAIDVSYIDMMYDTSIDPRLLPAYVHSHCFNHYKMASKESDWDNTTM